MILELLSECPDPGDLLPECEAKGCENDARERSAFCSVDCADAHRPRTMCVLTVSDEDFS